HDHVAGSAGQCWENQACLPSAEEAVNKKEETKCSKHFFLLLPKPVGSGNKPEPAVLRLF
ncbi:MAG TPA: hypothetical protein PLJ63_10785, partial [Flavobacteriales bacterium]|nr:hypothetical protein [Flavobacteriales bacterium]